MKALIAAGGRGTRLRPITYSMNKHMIPVANKPMIFHAIEKVAAVGITEIAININEGDEELPAAVGDGSRWGVEITFLEQIGGALGLAHIVKNAQEWLGDDDFVFYLGDNIIVGDLQPIVDSFKESDSNGYLVLAEVENPNRFGVPEIDENGNIVRVIEKPENPPSNYAVTGIYVYDKSVHEAVNNIPASERGEYEISDVHTYMIENGGTIKYSVVEGWWKDTGTPQDLLLGNSLMMDATIKADNQGMVAESVKVEGDIEIAPGAQISGDTTIVGPVSIGENASITNAHIGPHVTIGAHTAIEGGSYSNSIVMDDAKIHTSRSIKDSIIGHNVSIHETTGDDAHWFIGENSEVTF